jgi:hypothetical protein
MLFTKSRFKIALECPTKLWYNQKENQDVYKNILPENLFLQFLADNGHAIGEYAKFLYTENPLNPDITVRARGYDESVADTNRRLLDDIRNGVQKSIIAEAAIRHNNFFIRIDVLIVDHREKTLTIVEVKAKSVNKEVLSASFKKGGWFESKWLPYLYDVAFQKVVTEMAKDSILDGALKEYRVIPKLLLINSEETCDVEGLNQFVKVIRNPNDQRDVRIEIKEGTTREHLGNLNIFVEVDMTAIVEEIELVPLPHKYIPAEHRESLRNFMDWACEVHMNSERVFMKPDKRCKQCQFKALAGDSARSGIHECFAHAIQEGWLNGEPQDALDREKPLSIELWGGNAGPRSQHDVALSMGHAFVSDITPDAVLGNQQNGAQFSPNDRRMKQIELARHSFARYRAHKEALKRHLNSWEYPYHMIDFETTAPGIPYFEGMRPYETVAFQFSHHIMYSRRPLQHANQFIEVEPNGNPNIRFVRALRQSLMPNGTLEGTVFMYSKHERTTLNSIRDRIDSSSESDRQELLDFIDVLCSENSPKQMIDLRVVILETFIAKSAGGSNSIKQILPAILNESTNAIRMFSRYERYGSGLIMNSLNFMGPDGHVWFTEASNYDPYKTLPPIFEMMENETLDEQLLGFLGDNGGSIDQGGLAMAAYNFTRYNSLSDHERNKLRDGLLRYCELDTLAMCMIIIGLHDILHLP